MLDEPQPELPFRMTPPPVRASTPADRLAIDRVIGRAFFDDPIALYLFPDEARRRTRFGAFARLAMDQFADTGRTHVSDPVKGAAIWQGPSPHPIGFWRQSLMAFRLLLTAGGAFSRAVRLSEVMEAQHLQSPHWYLAILGTDPEHQGQGIGSALLQPTLDHCDETGLPACLESSKESNIPFYMRHGFEVTGEIRIPQGPIIWPMIRRGA